MVIMFCASLTLISTIVSSMVFWRYEDFVDQLRIMNIAVDDVLTQESISRYDLARYLNAIDCQDCINPSQTMQDTYIPTFRDPFVAITDNNFQDIAYRQAFYKQESYYYCVAYAWDNEYMNGYAVQTSPVCADKFCGERPTTKAEFLQIIVNIIEQYIHNNYITNWWEIADWLASATDYQQRWMTDIDRVNIRLGQEACGDDDCTVSDRFLFKTYLKYCSFNLDTCNMQEYGILKAWRWPLAQLNVLVQQGIISAEEAGQNDLHDPAKGDDVMEILYQAYQIIDCTFNNDYDCDGLLNNDDVCPNSYDPLQRDTDNDGVGNVCDDDIDGDGIWNPIGIVDHRDNVVISMYDPTMDNCLFVVNTDQADQDNDNIGDACQTWRQTDGLTTQVQNIQAAGTHYDVTLNASQNNTIRQLPDQSSQQGQSITISLPAGTHSILARSPGAYNDGLARVSVYLPPLESDTWLSHRFSPRLMSWDNNLVTLISSNTSSDIQRDISSFSPDNNTTTTETRTVSWPLQKILWPGVHTITASRRDPNNNSIIRAASQSIMIVDPITPASIGLETDSIQTTVDQPVTVTLMTAWLQTRDIQSLIRNRWDGTTQNTTDISQSHRYDRTGTYVVSVEVQTRNARHNVFVTLVIQDDTIQDQPITWAVWLDRTKAFLGEAITLLVESNLPNLWRLQNLLLQRAPGQTQRITDTQQTDFWYTYSQAGIYHPTASTTLSTCNTLTAQATIAIQWQDRCQEAVLDGSISQYQCDLDQDSIPDMCDDDIDGDGVKNSVWLIMFEQEGCVIDNNNIDPTLIQEHIQGICLLDNCPFVSNADQDDLNNNGIGTACPDLQPTDNGTDGSEENDRDNDGYTDNRDACPDVAENFNGFEDLDGCPEVWAENICAPDLAFPDGPFVDPLACNQCPCQYADYDGDLLPWDDVRAVLLNSGAIIRYSVSTPHVFEIPTTDQ